MSKHVFSSYLSCLSLFHILLSQHLGLINTMNIGTKMDLDHSAHKMLNITIKTIKYPQTASHCHFPPITGTEKPVHLVNCKCLLFGKNLHEVWSQTQNGNVEGSLQKLINMEFTVKNQ